MQSQVRLNRFQEKVPEKVPGGFGAEPGQVQQIPEKVPEKVWEALVQSQVKFNRVLEKVWEALVQSQVRFRRRFRKRFLEALVQRQVRVNRVREKVPEKVPEKVWEALVQSEVRFNRICGNLIDGNPAEVFPVLGFAARFRKICKNSTLRLLGIPPKLISYISIVEWNIGCLGIRA